MATPVLVNDRAVHCVREAATEINTRDGLEALLLVLEKMQGNMGLITSGASVALAYEQIHCKIAGLTSPPSKPPGNASP
jgi:hypothetical protein